MRNPEPFCCVLLLLVEMSVRLIPPLEMSCSSSKVPLGWPRRSPMAALSHKFVWLRYSQYNAYLVYRIQAIYIGKGVPMQP